MSLDQALERYENRGWRIGTRPVYDRYPIPEQRAVLAWCAYAVLADVVIRGFGDTVTLARLDLWKKLGGSL